MVSALIRKEKGAFKGIMRTKRRKVHTKKKRWKVRKVRRRGWTANYPKANHLTMDSGLEAREETTGKEKKSNLRG